MYLLSSRPPSWGCRQLSHRSTQTLQRSASGLHSPLAGFHPLILGAGGDPDIFIVPHSGVSPPCPSAQGYPGASPQLLFFQTQQGDALHSLSWSLLSCLVLPGCVDPHSTSFTSFPSGPFFLPIPGAQQMATLGSNLSLGLNAAESICPAISQARVPPGGSG